MREQQHVSAEHHHPKAAAARKRKVNARRALVAVIAIAVLVVLLAAVWGVWMLRRPKGPTPVLANPPAAGHVNATLSMPLIDAINGFGFDVLRKEVKASSDSPSIVLSPVSVHAALAMAESGSAEGTSKQMRQVLLVKDLSRPAEHQAYANLLVDLAEAEKGQLILANSLWIDKDNEFKQAFIHTNEQYFGAEARSVDLHSTSGVETINSWVTKNTGDRIGAVIAGPFPPTASIELLSAAHFLSAWQTGFDPQATKVSKFNTTSGPPVETPMMSVSGSFGHVKVKAYEAIRLPYKSGNTAMLVVLPSSKSSLPRLLKSLNADQLAKMRRSLTESHGTLRLPRVEARGTLQLKDTLSSMGMIEAFSSSRADFSAMTNTTPLWLDRVHHSTYLHVDEHGTEAAAATQVDVVGSEAPHEPFKMTVDRPYLMIILDERSGVVLFLAAVLDPRS